MKRTLILVLLSILQITLIAQSQFPPNTKWKEINTDHFRVIYPQLMENYAKETALIMDSVYLFDTKIYKENPKKIDLVLYNNSTVSNAFAQLAPRKMQWYLVPPNSPTLTLEPWNQILAIHEFRHVTQFSKLNKGFTRFASFFLGQYAQSALINWSVPGWFFEGDAVYSETIFSNSGRGRLPAFSLPVRTILLTNQKFSYEKALFNSYKTYYPNHYYLGYYMVSHINRTYGQDTWNYILRRTAGYSYWPYSFERSIKIFTDKGIYKQYKNTMHELDSMWSVQLQTLDTSAAEIVNTQKKRIWTNYTCPLVIAPDTLLIVKSGMDDNLSLYYLYADGTEKFIRQVPDDIISYANDWVAWTNYTTNPRYQEESFNDIVLYNLKTKQYKQITNKKRYFSPAFSNKGDKIAVITFNEEIKPKLVVLDLNGNETFSMTFDDSHNLFYPAWRDDDQNIVLLKNTVNGISMINVDLQTKEITTLIPEQWISMNRPVCNGQYVYFNYDYTGITNIFAYNFNTKKIYQVTQRPFNASKVTIDNKNNVMYFSDYQAKGTNVDKILLDSNKWIPLENVKQYFVNYFESEKTANQIKPFDSKYVEYQKSTITPKIYNQFKHNVNIHSWLPFIDNQNLGISLYSANVLNNLSIVTSVEGNTATKNLLGSISLEYTKFFPILGISATYGRDGEYFDKDFNKIDTLETWNYSNLSAYVSIPLNFSTDYHNRKFSFYAGANYINKSHFSGNAYDSLGLSYTKALELTSSLYFSNTQYKTYRQLYPRFGEAISIGVDYIPDLQGKTNFQRYALANVYFPGLMKNHGIRLTFGYEQKTPYDNLKTFVVNNSFQPLRGYPNFYFDKIYKFSFDYQMPLFYPDLNIPYLLFIKRVTAGVFYDASFVKINSNSGMLNSYGAEILFDVTFLRMWFLDVRIGFRLSLTPQGVKSYYLEPLISM